MFLHACVCSTAVIIATYVNLTKMRTYSKPIQTLYLYHFTLVIQSFLIVSNLVFYRASHLFCFCKFPSTPHESTLSNLFTVVKQQSWVAQVIPWGLCLVVVMLRSEVQWEKWWERDYSWRLHLGNVCFCLVPSPPPPPPPQPHIVVPVSLWHATDDVKLGNDTTGLMRE